MDFWPFCSTDGGTCTYLPAVLAIIIIIAVVVASVIKAIIRHIKESDGYIKSTIQDIDYSDTLGSDNESSSDESETFDEETEDELTVGEKWLKDNNLNDDTLGTLIYDYCGLRKDLVPVKVIYVDLKHNEITLSLQFPNTDIVRLIIFDLKKINFKIDDSSPQGNITADVSLDEDLEEDSPEYDDDQTPLEGLNWDEIAENLYVDLHLSRSTFDMLFPSIKQM
jgi:hypothetical protein